MTLNVWDKGGLFEQSVRAKIAGSDAMTRRNEAAIGTEMLTAQSAMANANTNQFNADTARDQGLRRLDLDRYGRETDRLNVSLGMDSRVNPSMARNLNLTTFRPMSSGGFGGYGSQQDSTAPAMAARASDLASAYRGVGYGVNPNVSGADARLLGPSMLSAAPAPQPSAPAMGSVNTPSSYAPGGGTPSGVSRSVGPDGRVTYTEQRPGLRYGGMIMKPKMVKQPGYMYGGKVKGYMHGGKVGGYKAGGKIGDVAKDDGTDKVDVVAREGEYFLNPETVAHVGGGNYEQGVRNLNALVREATGKEPGAVPVGKGGKPGFADSGVFDSLWEGRQKPEINIDELRAAQQARAARADIRAVNTPSGPTIYVDSAKTASTSPNMGAAQQALRQHAERFANQVPQGAASNLDDTDFFRKEALRKMAAEKAAARAAPAATGPTINVTSAGTASTDIDAARQADTARKWAERGRAAGESIGKGVRTGAKFVRGVAPNVAATAPVAGFGDYEIVDPVAASLGQPGIDSSLTGVLKNVVTGEGGKALEGIRAGAVEAGLDSLSGIAKTVDFATGLFGADMDLAGRLRRKVEADLGPMLKRREPDAAKAPGAPDQKTAPPPPTPAAAVAKSSSQVPAAANEPSLRDFFMNRLKELADEREDLGAMGSTRRTQLEQTILGQLANLEGQQIQANAAKAAAAAKANTSAEKRVEDTEKYLRERMQTPKYDDKGNIVGYFEDPRKIETLKNYIANLREIDGVTPFDFVNRPRTEQDRILEDFKRKYEMQSRFNARLMEQGVSLRSEMPRVNNQAYRIAIDPITGKPREIGFGDVGEGGIGFWDWVTSFGDNKLEKQIAEDPRTGQRIAARHMVGNDMDIYNQMLEAGQKADELDALKRAREQGLRR